MSRQNTNRESDNTFLSKLHRSHFISVQNHSIEYNNTMGKTLNTIPWENREVLITVHCNIVLKNPMMQ